MTKAESTRMQAYNLVRNGVVFESAIVAELSSRGISERSTINALMHICDSRAMSVTPGLNPATGKHEPEYRNLPTMWG